MAIVLTLSPGEPEPARVAAPEMICVAGTDKECGKTALAEAVLRALRAAGVAVAAAKVTRVHEGKCPTGDDCGACDSLRGDFEILSDERDPAEIGKAGTDSARLAAAAGGGPAYWVKTKREAAPRALAALREAARARGAARLVCESNTFWRLSEPGCGLLIARWPVPNPKAGVNALFPRADLLLEWGGAPNLAGVEFPARRARVAAPSAEALARALAALPLAADKK